MTTEKASAEPSRAIKLCGTEETDPPSRRLAPGRLSAELENGALRYIGYGGVEVLRAIAFLVRDENWGTYTPEIEQSEGRGRARRFRGQLSGAFARDSSKGSSTTRGFRFERRLAASSPPSPAGDRLPHQPHRLRRAASGRAWPASRSRSTHVDGRETEDPLSRASSARRSRCSTSARSPMKSCPACGRPAAWRATPSRWRISATGPTPHTRPTSGRSPCPGPTRSRAAGTSNPCSCRSPARRRRRPETEPRRRDRGRRGSRGRDAGHRRRRCRPRDGRRAPAANALAPSRAAAISSAASMPATATAWASLTRYRRLGEAAAAESSGDRHPGPSGRGRVAGADRRGGCSAPD